MRIAVVLIGLVLVACGPAQRATRVGEYGQTDGRWVLRECSTDQTYDVVLTSNAFGSYLDQMKALDQPTGQVVLVELTTVDIASPSSRPTLGGGRIVVRGGKCGV